MKPAVLDPTAKELYEIDFYEWTVRNAELLREPGHRGSRSWLQPRGKMGYW